jgi:predicted acylesterase/phospholipase RssA/tetratricopeptide (TPR) repeat protein
MHALSKLPTSPLLLSNTGASVKRNARQSYMGPDAIEEDKQKEDKLLKQKELAQAEQDWLLERILLQDNSLFDRMLNKEKFYAVDANGNNLLHVAACLNNILAIKILLTQGINLLAKNKLGETPLHTAIRCGNKEFATALIDEGVKVDETIKIRVGEGKLAINALGYAVLHGQLKVIKALLDHSEVQVNHLDMLLAIAVTAQQTQALTELLKHKNVIDQLDTNPGLAAQTFCQAAFMGNIAALQILAQSKPEVKGMKYNGLTPLHWAIKKNNSDLAKIIETIDWLLELGIDINSASAKGDSTSTYVAKLLSKAETSAVRDENEIYKYGCLAAKLANLALQLQQNKHKAPNYRANKIKNLVFQGGGPKGIAYVGALGALDQAIKNAGAKEGLGNIERVAGTSAGAITSALLAVGYTSSELNRELGKAKIASFIDSAAGKLAVEAANDRALKNIFVQFSKLFTNYLIGKENPRFFPELKKFVTKHGMCDGKVFRDWIEGLIREKIKEVTGKDIPNLTFGELHKLRKQYKQLKELHLVATDLSTEDPELFLFNSEDKYHADLVISDAVRCSMSIPGIFTAYPRHIKNKLDPSNTILVLGSSYVDGGLIKNYPIDIFDISRYQQEGISEGRRDYPIFNEGTIGFTLFNPSENKISDDKQSDTSKHSWLKHIIGRSHKKLAKSKDHWLGMLNVFFEAENLLIKRLEHNKWRTIKINCADVTTFTFDPSEEQKNKLISNGFKAVQGFFTDTINENRLVSNDLVMPVTFDQVLVNFEPIQVRSSPFAQLLQVTAPNKQNQGQPEIFEKVHNIPTPPKQFEKVHNIPTPPKHYQETYWRNELQERLRKLSDNNKPGYPVMLAVTGTPGSGKTELAKAFAYEYSQQLKTQFDLNQLGLSQVPVVRYLLADNVNNLWSNYRNLANDLGIDTNRLKEEDDNGWHNRICSQVNQILSKTSGWLLIFDNAEDLNVIQPFLPLTGAQNGTVLFTTRNAAFIEFENCLDISKGLAKEEAVKLLSKESGISSDEGAADLAEALEYLPLYLLVSASTIKALNETNPERKWTYTDYKKHIEVLTPSQIQEEQELYVGHIPGCTKTQHRVIRSALKSLGSQCRDLLFLCSCINFINIPRDLLKNFVKIKNPDFLEAVVDLELIKLLAEIQKSSLLQQVPQQSKYDIHKMVQSIIRADSGLATPTNINDVLQSILNPLRKAKYYRSLESTKQYKSFLPHVMSINKQANLLKLADQSIMAQILEKYGVGSFVLGNSTKAKELLEEALKISENHYGKNSPEVAGILGHLGPVYRNLDDPTKAKESYERALPILEDKYGKYSPEVAKILVNLGNVLQKLGDLQQAKQLYERVKPIIVGKYGENHRETSIILEDLGCVEMKLGNLTEAKSLLERTLKIRENPQEENTQLLAKVLVNLAHLYRKLNELTETERLLERALKIEEDFYGKDNPLVAKTLGKLAIVYKDLNDPKKANESYERALAILNSYSDKDNLEVTKTLGKLTGPLYKDFINIKNTPIAETAKLLNISKNPIYNYLNDEEYAWP